MREVIDGYEGKTVVVTGGGGYLGSALIEALRKTPAIIIRVSRRELPALPGVESYQADIGLRDCWSTIIDRADIIFHLAGNTSVYAAAKDSTGSLNSTLLPLTHLLTVAQERGRHPVVVYASTATLYGLTEKLPVSEEATPRPITVYDLHKLHAEEHLALATRKGILEGVSLRLANVYGPSPSTNGSDDRGVLNKVARLALQGRDLSLYGDGNYLRDYVYISDVVRAFILAGITKNIGGRSFNVGTGQGVTLSRAFQIVAEQAERVTGRPVKINNIPWPVSMDPIERRNFIAETKSLANATNWLPTISLQEGIHSMINGFSPDSGKLNN